MKNDKDVNEFKPALSPNTREDQLIFLATELAEKKLRDGTASSQLISHYLKMGSEKERIEREILMRQRDLIIAKTETLNTMQKNEALYLNAINAMKAYSGEDENL